MVFAGDQGKGITSRKDRKGIALFDHPECIIKW